MKRIGLLVLLAGLAAAMVVGTWLVAEDDSDGDSDSPDQAARELAAAKEAEAEGRELLLDMTSYDFRTVDEDFAWLDRITDETLRKRMDRNVADLKKVIRQGKVTAEGQVLDSGYRVLDEDRVVVLAFVDQEIRDQVNEGFREDQQRVSLTLVREDDEWMIESLQLHNEQLAQ